MKRRTITEREALKGVMSKPYLSSGAGHAARENNITKERGMNMRKLLRSMARTRMKRARIQKIGSPRSKKKVRYFATRLRGQVGQSAEREDGS